MFISENQKSIEMDSQIDYRLQPEEQAKGQQHNFQTIHRVEIDFMNQQAQALHH